MLSFLTAHPRRRVLSVAAGAALLLTLSVAVGATSSTASAGTHVAATVPVEVTKIQGTVPLLLGGLTVILNEEAKTTAPISIFDFIEGYESLDLHFRQTSIERFSSYDFATARAISGEANGTITATSTVTGQSMGSGSYTLSMSNTPGCQMKGVGTWSMSADKFDVSGTVSSCVNWDASIEKFTGDISIDGDVELKKEASSSGGLIRRVLGGLLGG